MRLLHRLASGFALGLLGLALASPGAAADRPLRGHEGEVTAVAFSSDGKQLVTGGADRTVRLWEADTGKEIRSLNGHKNPIADVMFSPDGKHVASQDAQDRSWNLWNLESGKKTGPLPGSHWGASFTPDGERFVSTTDIGDKVTRQRWNVATGEAMAPPPEFKPPLPSNAPKGRQTVLPGSFAYSPDGLLTAATGETRVQGPMLFEAFPWLAVRQREECKILAHREIPRTNSTRVMWSPDGKKLLVSSGNPRGTTRVFDPRTLNEEGQIPARALGVASDNKHVLGRGEDGSLGLYDLGTGKQVAPLPGSVAAASPKTPLLAVGGKDGVTLMDMPQGRD